MSSYADIGIRVFLLDQAAQGFLNLTSLMGGMGGRVGMLSSLFRGLSDTAGSSAGRIQSLEDRFNSAVNTMDRAALSLTQIGTQMNDVRAKIAGIQAAGPIFKPDEATKLSDLGTKLQGLQTNEAALVQGTDLLRQSIASMIPSDPNLPIATKLLGDYEKRLVSTRTEIGNTKTEMQAITDVGVQRQAEAIKPLNERLLTLQDRMAQVGMTYRQASEAANTATLRIDEETAAAEQAAAKQDMLNSAMMGFMVSAGLFGIFTAAIKGSIDASAQLQQSMVAVRQGVEGADAVLPQLTSDITSLADNSKFSSSQIADGFAQLGAMGQNAAAILGNNGVLGQAMVDLATAMGQDGTTGAAKLLGMTLQMFGGQASDAAQYADILTTAFHNGIPNISQLTDAIHNSGASAAEMKVPLSELATYLDILAQKLGSGSMAGTDLNNILLAMQNPTAKATKAMSDLGLMTFQTSDKFKAFEEELANSGSAGAKAVQAFDGTASGLQALYTAAGKANIKGMGSDWLAWAYQIGAVNNKMFDAKGNFAGMNNMLAQFETALSGLDPEAAKKLLGDIFNKTALKGFEDLLTEYDKTKQNAEHLTQKMREQGTAARDAAAYNQSYDGRLTMLKTTIQTVAAQIGSPLRDTLAGFFGFLNQAIGGLAAAGPGLSAFAGNFFLVGAAASGVTALVTGLVMALLAFDGVGAVAMGVGAAIGFLVVSLSALTSWVKQNPAVAHAFGMALIGLGGAAAIAAAGFGGFMLATQGLGLSFMGPTASMAAMGTAFRGIKAAALAVNDGFGNIVVSIVGGLSKIPEALEFVSLKWEAFLEAIPDAAVAVKDFVLQIPSLVAGLWQATLAFLKAIPAMAAHTLELLKNAAASAWNAIVKAAAEIPGVIASTAAWLAYAAAVILANAPIILITVLIAAMIAGLVILVVHLAKTGQLMQMWHATMAVLGPIFSQIGGIIRSAFTQALQQLAPVWQQLVAAFNQAKPTLMFLGAILGGVIVGVLVLLVGVVAGVAVAFAHFLAMVIGVAAGIIQVFMGVIQFFMGFFTVLRGLFTGNWALVGAGFQQMGAGIVNIFMGMWNAIKAVFVGAFNIIWGFISTFIATVVGIFTHLADVLVGHSIVPDMLKAILQWFIKIPTQIIAWIGQFIVNIINAFLHMSGMSTAQINAMWTLIRVYVNVGMSYIRALIQDGMALITAIFHGDWGKAGHIIQDMWGLIKGFVSLGMSGIRQLIQDGFGHIVSIIQGFGQAVFNAGANIVNMIANGIRSAIGAVVGAMGDVGNAIMSHLPHSPADEGPLRHIDKPMPAMMRMFASGIRDNIHVVRSAMVEATGIMDPSSNLYFPGTGRMAGQRAAYSVGGGAGGGGGHVTHVHVYMDSKEIGTQVMQGVNNDLRMNGFGRAWR